MVSQNNCLFASAKIWQDDTETAVPMVSQTSCHILTVPFVVQNFEARLLAKFHIQPIDPSLGLPVE